MLWIRVLAFPLLFWSGSYEDSVGFSEEGADCTHQQYASMGASEVFLHCPVPKGISTVEWRVNSSSGAILKEAREDGSLALWNTSLAQEGEYSCHDPTTGQVLRRVHLQLGYPPGEPTVQCRSASYPSAINCSWKLETETHLETSFFSTYRYGMEGVAQECVQPTAGAASCSIADVQMFSIIPYMLNVTAVNPLGMATHIFPFFLNEIIKPDPPEDVEVSPIPGERRKLLLKWKPPSSWLLPEYFPLKYKILYMKDGTSNNGKPKLSEQTSLVLSGIYPGTTYHVQVAAKDFLDHGEYSAWSVPATGAAWKPE